MSWFISNDLSPGALFEKVSGHGWWDFFRLRILEVSLWWGGKRWFNTDTDTVLSVRLLWRMKTVWAQRPTWMTGEWEWAALTHSAFTAHLVSVVEILLLWQRQVVPGLHQVALANGNPPVTPHASCFGDITTQSLRVRHQFLINLIAGTMAAGYKTDKTGARGSILVSGLNWTDVMMSSRQYTSHFSYIMK